MHSCRMALGLPQSLVSAMADNEFPGYQEPNTQATEYNATQFMAEQIASRISTATLVKVVKVTTTGAVAAVGQVDVQPLVKMQDANGKVLKHGNVHSLPYFRLQGGAGKAIIMDPKVGDIGVAIFADRDISSVKANKAEAAPGSFRRFDMADGMFLGCFLGEAPTCYIRFTDDNKIIASPDNGTTIMTIEANKITHQVNSTLVQITPTRVDLGGTGGSAVATVDGYSTLVFAKL